MQDMPSGWLHATALSLIAFVCFGIYAWTADFPMVFDDDYYMRESPMFPKDRFFPHLDGIREFATKPMRTGADPDLATNIILRPVAYATFTLNHMLDGFNPRWYRAANIAIHAANSALIHALVLLLFVQSGLAARLRKGTAAFTAGMAAILFAAHPLATESVTYIIQRFTSLAAMFYLGALVLHLRANTVESTSRRLLLRAVSALLCLTGMLTKEGVFTMPVMAVVIDWLVIGTAFRTAVRRAVPLLALMPLIPAQLSLTSWLQNEGGWNPLKVFHIVNSLDKPTSQWHYLLTQVTVAADYLRLIAWPAGLNLDPEWPVHRSLFSGPVMKGLAVLGGMLAAAFWLWRRRRSDARAALVLASVIWFFVTLAPSSSLMPLPDMKAEHRSYLPSIGIFIAVSCLAGWVFASRWRFGQAAAAAFAMAAAAALSAAACVRNEVWRTNVALLEDTVAKSPGHYRPWSNLGVSYAEVERHEDAIAAFKKALELEPRHTASHINLATILCQRNRPQEALEHLNRLFRSSDDASDNPQLTCLMGYCFAATGRTAEAMLILEELTLKKPDYHAGHLLLGRIFASTNRHRRAKHHLLMAMQLAPDNEDVRKRVEEAMPGLVLANSSL